MAFLKDFLDTLRLSDDDDFDMDDYDDYREAELEKERKKAAKAKKKEEAKARRMEDDDDEPDDELETERKSFLRRPAASKTSAVKTSTLEPVETKPATRAGFRFAQQNRSAEETTSTLSAPAKSIRPSVPRSTQHSLREVRIMRPTTFEDSQDICDALLSGKPIIVNLENFDMDMAQRVMDFVCGCLYSIDGKLHQISGYIFIISPDDVDISGDYLALMRQDGFGVPTFNRKL